MIIIKFVAWVYQIPALPEPYIMYHVIIMRTLIPCMWMRTTAEYISDCPIAVKCGTWDVVSSYTAATLTTQPHLLCYKLLLLCMATTFYYLCMYVQ